MHRLSRIRSGVAFSLQGLVLKLDCAILGKFCTLYDRGSLKDKRLERSLPIVHSMTTNTESKKNTCDLTCEETMTIDAFTKPASPHTVRIATPLPAAAPPPAPSKKTVSAVNMPHSPENKKSKGSDFVASTSVSPVSPRECYWIVRYHQRIFGYPKTHLGIMFPEYDVEWPVPQAPMSGQGIEPAAELPVFVSKVMVRDGKGWKPLSPRASVRTPSSPQEVKVRKGAKPIPEHSARYQPYPLHTPPKGPSSSRGVSGPAPGARAGLEGTTELVRPLRQMSVAEHGPISPVHSPTDKSSHLIDEHAHEIARMDAELKKLKYEEPTDPVTGARVDPAAYYPRAIKDAQSNFLQCVQAFNAHGVSDLSIVENNGWLQALPIQQDTNQGYIYVDKLYNESNGGMAAYLCFYNAHKKYSGMLASLKRFSISADKAKKFHEEMEAELAHLSLRNFPNLSDYQCGTLFDSMLACAQATASFLESMCRRNMAGLCTLTANAKAPYISFRGYHMTLPMFEHYQRSLENPMYQSNRYLHSTYGETAFHYFYFKLRKQILEARYLEFQAKMLTCTL